MALRRFGASALNGNTLREEPLGVVTWVFGKKE